MSRDDRRIAHARRHLDEGELVLASALGREIGGRRGRVVLVSDRRVIIAWTRPEPADDLPLQTCTARYDSAERILTITDAGRSIQVRDVEPVAARPVVECITSIAGPPLAERLGPAFKVRIVGA